MEYLNYIYEIVQDIYDELYFRYIDFTYNIPDKKINIFYTQEYDDEINKLIEDTKKEIKIDKEIKQLEERYTILCKDVNKLYENDNENDNDNGAIKLKNKSRKVGVSL